MMLIAHAIEPEPWDLLECRVLHFAPENSESGEGDGEGVVQAPFSVFPPDCLSGVKLLTAPASVELTL